MSRPLKRQKDGTFTLKLTGQEREILANLPTELIKALQAGEDERAVFRLFPPAYTNDLGRQVEYDTLMRDDLLEHHLSALRTLEETANANSLSEVQLDTWVRALNQLRLVLGTRLDITDDTTEDDFDPDNPAAGAYALYTYLSYLQSEVVDALSETLDVD